MQIIENLKVKEKIYTEKLENGLTVIIIPKKEIQKKYIIWGTNFGSIDNHFIVPNTNEEIQIPDGVAHFLEHKMFEQENGTNSLDVLSSLGVDANAYTTNDHTAYLFEATDNFYEALDEFMDYVQNPYYTDENVEKEKGIISQEIKMYDDYPAWQVYMNAMRCMYSKNPIKIDIAGTVESIQKIDKEVLYNCYNTFYNPSNMVLVVSGDFVPEELLKEIKNRLIQKPNIAEIKRIYEEEPKEIAQKEISVKMDVNNPIFVIGFKDTPQDKKNMVKKHIALEIILYMLIGKSSKLYKKLYEEGLLMTQPDLDYEWSKEYAHVTITGQSKEPRKVLQELVKEIENLKQNGLDENSYKRVKKKIYGDYITEYNSIQDISRMFLADYMRGINSFDYIEEFEQVTLENAKQMLEEVFREENMVFSVVEK